MKIQKTDSSPHLQEGDLISNYLVILYLVPILMRSVVKILNGTFNVLIFVFRGKQGVYHSLIQQTSTLRTFTQVCIFLDSDLV